MGRLIGILLLAVSMNLSAAGIVNQWYEQQYEAVQERQQIEFKKKAASRCEKKIEKYTRLLRASPSDRWYQWRLNSWKRRCKEDSSNNPYIKR